jgi:hypothetical protein
MEFIFPGNGQHVSWLKAAADMVYITDLLTYAGTSVLCVVQEEIEEADMRPINSGWLCTNSKKSCGPVPAQYDLPSHQNGRAQLHLRDPNHTGMSPNHTGSPMDDSQKNKEVLWIYLSNRRRSWPE